MLLTHHSPSTTYITTTYKSMKAFKLIQIQMVSIHSTNAVSTNAVDVYDGSTCGENLVATTLTIDISVEYFI